MFKYIYYIGYDSVSHKHTYKLVDSDFEIVIGGEIEAIGIGIMDMYGGNIGIAVANEYKKRNLNVTVNLALMYKKATEYYGYNLNKFVELNNKYYPELSKEFYYEYLHGIKKYMLLM